jgi:hypothetical protein
VYRNPQYLEELERDSTPIKKYERNYIGDEGNDVACFD